MKNVKYQVFVSSTFEDLRAEREQVVKAVLEMGHIPVGMEMFSAADDDQWELISRNIETSDYYVLVVAHRYGSTDATGRSFTEREYDYAVRSGIPTMAFVISDTAPWPATRVETDGTKRQRLEIFKEKIKTRYVSFWSSADDLYGRVSVALGKQFAAKPRPGWIRSDEGMSSEVAMELVRLSRENAELRSQLEVLEVRTKVDDATDGAWRHFFHVIAGAIGTLETLDIKAENLKITAVNQALSRLDLDVIGTPTEEFLPDAALIADATLKGLVPDKQLVNLRQRVVKRLKRPSD
jgi:hypothetical protein